MENMILQDRRVKVSVIAHELGISAGTVSSINHSVLMMSMVSSRWVPGMLTPEQKACRQQFSEQNLYMLREIPENFSKIITGDETRVIIMIQRSNRSPCNVNTRGSLLPRNFVCNNQPERSWQHCFGTQRVFCFWN